MLTLISIDHVQWVWLCHVAIYTQWWLRVWKRFLASSLCTNAGSYSNMTCTIIMALHVCIYDANMQTSSLVFEFVEIARLLACTNAGSYSNMVCINHDFTLCVYVANMQTSLKSLLVFACTAMFLSISAIHFVYTNMATTTRTYLES